MSELHICGLLLLCRPGQAGAVTLALDELAGVELHADDGGRMVVTLEGPDYGRCADLMATLATLPGVASSSLVYHHIEHNPLEEVTP